MLMSSLLARRFAFSKPIINSFSCNRHCFFRTSSIASQLKLGDITCVDKNPVSQEEVRVFAELTDDTNPIHLDPEFAKNTRFRKPIVHGALAVSLISGVVSKTVPEGSIVLSAGFEFLAPLFVGDPYKVEVKVGEIEGRKVAFHVRNFIDDKTLVKGVFNVLVPKNK